MTHNDLIWTNHALERLKNRKISDLWVIQTIVNPDREKFNNGGVEYQKKFDNQIVAAIVKKNDKGEKVILSCWIDPPNPGTADFKKKKRYKEKLKASFAKKLWLTFLDQIGL